MENYTVVAHGVYWHVHKNGTVVCALEKEQEARRMAAKLNEAKVSPPLSTDDKNVHPWK